MGAVDGGAIKQIKKRMVCQETLAPTKNKQS